MIVARGTTLVDYLIPASEKSRSLNLLRDALLIIGFSLLTALCAQVSFYLPSMPVPITLQTLAVLLTGAALGRWRGALAMLAYLAEGSARLPFFAGGAAGFPLLTGGYLIGFILAAFVVGWLCERGLDRSPLTSALAMLPGSVIIYLVGATWLGVVLHASAATAIAYGVTPFLIGDLLKLIAATLLLPAAWGLLRRVRPTEGAGS